MRLKQAVANLKSAVDFELERGGGLDDRMIEVSFNSLLQVVSWFDDVRDNDHVNVYSFLKD